MSCPLATLASVSVTRRSYLSKGSSSSFAMAAQGLRVRAGCRGSAASIEGAWLRAPAVALGRLVGAAGADLAARAQEDAADAAWVAADAAVVAADAAEVAADAAAHGASAAEEHPGVVRSHAS